MGIFEYGIFGALLIITFILKWLKCQFFVFDNIFTIKISYFMLVGLHKKVLNINLNEYTLKVSLKFSSFININVFRLITLCTTNIIHILI